MGAALILETGYRAVRMEADDQSISTLLAKKDEAAFEQVFKTYFKNLHAYACSILKDEAEAEEMVQQVFFKLWDRAENLSFSGPIAAYLYRAIHNECLNYIKHQKVRSNHQLYVAHSMKNQSEQEQGRLVGKELEARYKKALEELPEQCRLIFQLSRFGDMKYREIADELGISVKTVENQMGKALKILRQKLVEFLPVLFILINL
ncbi:MAG: RNA polymerase sigma-70 factor [Chitinophagaceae bacterium]